MMEKSLRDNKQTNKTTTCDKQAIKQTINTMYEEIIGL